MSEKNQKKIKSLEKTIEFFPNIDYFKKQLVLYKWADLLDIEINGSYYPRLSNNKTNGNYVLFVNENCILFINKNKEYCLIFNIYEDAILYYNKNKINNFNRPLIEKFKKLQYKEYVKYELSNNKISGVFTFDLENGKKALKVYNDFISELEKEKK